jgi:hypothetical protein
MTSTQITDRPSPRTSRRLHVASSAVRSMLGAQIAMAVVHFLSVPQQIAHLGHIHERVQLVRVELLQRALSDTNTPPLIWWSLVIATALTFGVWLRTAYSQLERVGGERRSAKAWAFVGWFVPVANLWIPKKILNDIIAVQRRRLGRPVEATGLWVTVWWASWVVTAVGTYFTLVMTSSATHVSDAQNGIAALAACDAAVVVCAILGCIAVKRVTRSQRALLVGDVISTARSPRGHGGLPSSRRESHVDAVGPSA